MSPGKLCSQAGHAYLGACLQALKTHPELASAYTAQSPGTKVCLHGSLAELSQAQEQLKAARIPHFLVIDSGCPNFFDGQPIITALGFGPAKRLDLKRITRRLKLLT